MRQMRVQFSGIKLCKIFYRTKNHTIGDSSFFGDGTNHFFVCTLCVPKSDVNQGWPSHCEMVPSQFAKKHDIGAVGNDIFSS